MTETSPLFDLFIKPMIDTFPPPVHLRDDPDAQRRLLGDYARCLVRYSPEVLRRAWDHVVSHHNYWCWPTLATAREACDRSATEALKPHPAADPPGRAALELAASMAYRYRVRFMKTSAVAKRAADEGWDDRLARYVEDVAFVQAQLIAGVPGPKGYSSTIGGPSSLPLDERRGVIRETLARAKVQAETGTIQVRVPKRLEAAWRREAIDRQGRTP